MQLTELRNKIKEFELLVGFNVTEFSKLVTMIEKEVKILKSNPDKATVDHQLTDLLVLIMQIANRYDTDFDKELLVWFEKSKKYLS